MITALLAIIGFVVAGIVVLAVGGALGIVVAVVGVVGVIVFFALALPLLGFVLPFAIVGLILSALFRIFRPRRRRW